MPGIYIHIPFCKQRCRYCAFYSSTKHHLQHRYINALCRELSERNHYTEGAIETIYLGGGTPSTLTAEALSCIFETISQHFHIADNPEITLESNPDDLTREYIQALRTLPINRLSIGIQSLNDRQLSALGRRHNAQKAQKAVAEAQDAGFDNISIDLMFALPSSTLHEWENDIKHAIALSPQHISAYNLTYEEGTPLYQSMQQGKIKPIDEDINIAQFETLIKYLKEAGYHHYEISNFAKPGYESRHNSSYWNDTPYIGCGAAAHSYNGNSRRWNISDIEQYIIGVENGKNIFEEEHLSKAEKYNDAILTRLRTSKGIPLQWIADKFGDDFAKRMYIAAKKHITAGCLTEENGSIRLTTKGIFISDYIIRNLIIVD